jgi:hypothetical protein
MVTELMMRIKVIKLTKSKGRLASPQKGKDLKTWLASGHMALKNLVVPYEIRKAPNVSASDNRKNHIIILP